MTLQDICELIVDCPHSTAKDEGEGYPLIRTPNIGKGRLFLEGVHRVSKDIYEKRNLRATPRVDDIIFAREAPAGNAAIIKEGQTVCLGQRTVLIRPNSDIVYPKYLVYYLLAPEQQYKLLGSANGATVAHVNMSIIRKMAVELPEMEIQIKIADIISAYDDLIENNQKQIKLLEEAAQRLYKEWFVDLHFPGYEDVKVVEGVPEGWKKERLVDIANVQYGYAFDGSKFNDRRKGMPIIRIRNIPSGDTSDYTTEDADIKYLISNGEILVGMDGEFHINSWSGDDAYLVQRCCCFRPKKKEMNGWLLWAINEPIKFYEKTVVGATVSHLGKKHIDAIELLTGPEELYIPFHQYFEKRQHLLNQNRLLAEACDRLLPKLISGEIEV
jgi:type I restriction enzyme S subunit